MSYDPRLHDPLPDDAAWRALGADPALQGRMAQDLYFREGWADATSALGPSAAHALADIALLNVKPDAVVGRRMTGIVDFASAHGFQPIVARRVGFSRHSMREIWRYDWRVYPSDRLAFTTVWYTACDVLLLLLRDTAPAAGAAAGAGGAARLSALKGSALASERRPTDLRSVLKPPNRVLNFVHIADTAADVVRELGVFFDRDERRRIFAEIAAPPTTSGVAEVVARLEADHPPHDLAFARSLDRLAGAGLVNAAGAADLRGARETGRPMSWAEVMGCIDPLAIETARWDLVTVASHVLPPELPRAAAPARAPAGIA